jgi:hypothetical protein
MGNATIVAFPKLFYVVDILAVITLLKYIYPEEYDPHIVFKLDDNSGSWTSPKI